MDGYRFLAVRWQGRYIIVPLASIVRIEACSDRVRIFAERTYGHRETLSGLSARLPDDAFVRVHRSHIVNIDAVAELRPLAHGEYALALRDGSTVMTGRSYRHDVEASFGLASARPRT